MSAPEWYEQPITRADVEQAVDAYLPVSFVGTAERADFIEHNAVSWVGVVWREAEAWNLATEWAVFRRMQG